MTRSADLRTIDVAVTTLTRVGHSHRARRRIEERSGVSLGPTTMAVLAAVRAQGSARHGEIARRLGVQPSRTSKELRLLLDLGHVVERADPTDRRAALVELTPTGEAAYRAYRQAAEKALSEVLGDWTDRDLHSLAGLIDRLAHAFAARGER